MVLGNFAAGKFAVSNFAVRNFTEGNFTAGTFATRNFRLAKICCVKISPRGIFAALNTFFISVINDVGLLAFFTTTILHFTT